jgi:hypothetical protein
MADDFADKFSSPVVHVKWWGSYLNKFTTPNFPVDKFLISFESDIPAAPNVPFSRPNGTKHTRAAYSPLGTQNAQ